jgi:hypothetical protein
MGIGRDIIPFYDCIQITKCRGLLHLMEEQYLNFMEIFEQQNIMSRAIFHLVILYLRRFS